MGDSKPESRPAPSAWVGGWQCLGAPDSPAPSAAGPAEWSAAFLKVAAPALIETKESNGSIHTSSSISEARGARCPGMGGAEPQDVGGDGEAEGEESQAEGQAWP